LPGRGATWVWERLGAFDQIRLAQVIFCHGAIELAEFFQKNRFLLERERKLAPERYGHGIACHIVLSRTKAADQDKDVRTLERRADCLDQPHTIVADHVFGGNLDTQQIEMPRNDQRIRVHTLGREQFTAYGDDLRLLRG